MRLAPELLGLLCEPCGFGTAHLACRQVFLGALVTPHFPSVSAQDWMHAWSTSFAYEFQMRLMSAAEILCPLEALAHHTEDAQAQLALAQAEFRALLDEAAFVFPPDFPARQVLRIFAGLALAQRAWLEESGFETADRKEKEQWILESPALGWSSFALEFAGPNGIGGG